MPNLEDLLIKNRLADEARFDRIEGKIDRLSDTVVAIARAEEKLVALEQTKRFQNKKIEELETTLKGMNRQLENHTHFLATVTRIFWILTSVALTGLGGMYISAFFGGSS